MKQFFNLNEFLISYTDFRSLGPKKWIWPITTLLLISLVWLSIFLLTYQAQFTSQKQNESLVKLNMDEISSQLTTAIDQIQILSSIMEYEQINKLDPAAFKALGGRLLSARSKYWTISILDNDNHIIRSTNIDRVGAVFNVGKNVKAVPSSLTMFKTSYNSLFSLPTLHFIRKFTDSTDLKVLVSIPEDAFINDLHLREDMDLLFLSQTGELLSTNGTFMLDQEENFFYNFDTTKEVFFLDAKYFVDKAKHLVSWSLPANVSVIVIAGFSTKALDSDLNQLTSAYFMGGFGTTLLLIVVGALATIMYCKLILNNRSRQELESAYRSATEGAMDGFFILKSVFDDEGVLVNFIVQDCNRRGAGMLGWNKQKLIGTALSDIVSFDLFQLLLKKYSNVINLGFMPAADEFLIDSVKPAELRNRWVYHRCIYTKTGVAVTLRDITDEKNHVKSLTFAAEHDVVTELPNRKWLTKHIPDYLTELSNKNKTAYFLFIDLDGFKQVNDTYGHDVGDLLLKAVGQRLSSTLRKADIVVRLGGDEFVAAIYENAENVDIHMLCSRILLELKKPFHLDGNVVVSVGASIGVSEFPKFAQTLDQLLIQADAAMYAIKKSSKGAYKIFEK